MDNASNLNGLYLSGPEAPCTKGVNWFTCRGYSYSLKRTEMKKICLAYLVFCLFVFFLERKSCVEFFRDGWMSSGVHTINPDPGRPIQVLCDITTDEFWLGTDNLHRLIAADEVILRVDLKDFEGNVAYAEYATFKVADEATKYQLLVGGYNGSAGDSMTAMLQPLQ
ncbi:unnamed protein product [Pocillopora meandrina]|uniref:Fibrinogen C-terminal domain-containing protein n=1 Tax=Pocillopora meandrina TaxID=46732 RepID=A0AAU9X7I4_9CNID|nr:unnamed protein product [Pocillopora meandrina]